MVSILQAGDLLNNWCIFLVLGGFSDYPEIEPSSVNAAEKNAIVSPLKIITSIGSRRDPSASSSQPLVRTSPRTALPLP